MPITITTEDNLPKWNKIQEITTGIEKRYKELSCQYKELKKQDIQCRIIKAENTVNAEKLKELHGIGAYCPDIKTIRISIDTEHPSLQEDPSHHIAPVIIHELHHVQRRLAGIDIDNTTLLECIISEGMADAKAEELCGTLPVWQEKVEMEEQLLEELTIFIQEQGGKIQMSKERYKAWFLGEGEKIPRWAGYKIGYNLYKKAQSRGLKKEKSITMSAEEIIKQ